MYGARVGIAARLLLKDPQAMKYSDFQLLEGMNTAVGMIYRALGRAFSSLARRRATLIPVDGSADLPEDFWSFVRMERTDGADEYEGWEMEGNQVLSSLPSLELVYYRVPLRINSLNDDIDAAEVLFDDIAAITVLCVEGSLPAAEERARTAAGQVAQRRDWGTLPERRGWR